MLIGSYPFRYRSRRDRRFSAATGQFSSNELIDSRTRCSPALGLRTGKATVRFTFPPVFPTPGEALYFHEMDQCREMKEAFQVPQSSSSM
jgi:hypothetical protein